MEYKATLDETLRNRFDDLDEMKDIYNYGIKSGFSDFIYSSELYEFFKKFESEIEDYLYEVGVTFDSLVQDKEQWTFQEMREAAVWSVVECWIFAQIDG